MKNRKKMLKVIKEKVINILTFLIDNKEIIYKNLENKNRKYRIQNAKKKITPILQ